MHRDELPKGLERLSNRTAAGVVDAGKGDAFGHAKWGVYDQKIDNPLKWRFAVHYPSK